MFFIVRSRSPYCNVGFCEVIDKDALFRDAHNLPGAGERAVLESFPGGSFARFIARAQKSSGRPFLVVVDDMKRAAVLLDEILFFNPEARADVLPPYDVLPYHGLSPHPQTVLRTVSALHRLGTGKSDVLIVPEKALWRRHIPRALYESLVTKAVCGFRVNREALIQDLAAAGYERSPVVEEPGQFAVRGDVVDVFSPHEADPVRLSFFDREIESVRVFDPVSQRSGGERHEAFFVPAREILLDHFASPSEDKLLSDFIRTDWKSALKARVDARDLPKSKRDQIEDFVANGVHFHGIETFLPVFYRSSDSLFDYLPAPTVIVRDTTGSLVRAAGDFLTEMDGLRESSSHIETAIAPREIFLGPDETAAALGRFTVLENGFAAESAGRETAPIRGGIESNQILKTRLGAQIAKIHNLAPLASELNRKRLEGVSCRLVCRNEAQAERARDLLARFDLPIASSAAERASAETARLIELRTGPLHEGFLDPAEREWWIADEEIFGKKTRRASGTVAKTSVFSSFSELSEGDYLIHMDHGIGVYRGLVKLSFDAHKNDFLMIEYLGGDKLYVPVDRLNRVQRYAAEEGAVPQLDKLGGTTWAKVRQKAKRAARKLAAELLRLQAVREAERGYAFQPRAEEMQEFAAGFEFEETPDQQQAIEDVLKDMESARPMDRLICGDVGFGKTEVAIRAAYAAILEKKQAAVLVPTTVLAFQHYATFKKRLEGYAARVELLSRFRSAKEQDAVVRGVKEGQVDIVVGTHRLLSQDVKFLDLGLLVIDEEHRFGVIHKERIKKLKNLVDVMTLTATPIPRTLNFALNGIRDLSIINTPPVDRLAIKTYVTSFDEATLRDAMLKEIRRGGQVYFVHNRVQSIEKMTQQVSKMLPEARVRLAHGQMDEEKLETIMIDFMNHEFDVLVCTTIIESGLDIPNCNTIVINRADGMGLAQLYQLRGRVGRSHHQAYCYLIIPDEELVNPKAKKRLAAIQKFTELGSGFRIASHDLEIRGAGNILGDEQSGHIAAVGYDMYVHLLKEAIHELKNEAVPEDFAPEVVLNVPAKIPEAFVPDAHLRLLLYKQLSSAENDAEALAIAEEWADRFGRLPEEIRNLVEIIRIRVLCRDLLVASVKRGGNKTVFVFHPNHRIDTVPLATAVQKQPKVYSIARDGAFVITKDFPSDRDLLEHTRVFLEGLKVC